MRKFFVALALAAFIPAAALAIPYQTTGGYGSPVSTIGVPFQDTEGQKATFTYFVNDVTPVATATDVITVAASATKTVRIRKVCVEGNATASANYDVYLVKRTAANTGGTSTNPTPVSHDSTNAASGATVTLYTANPSALGTGSNIGGVHLFVGQAATSPALGTEKCWTFGDAGSESLVLNGAAQSLAINHNGGAVPSGASMYYSVTWTEE